MNPKRIDNQPIEVIKALDGRVFVDPERGRDHRGGPEYPRHFCRFEEYGLEGGLVRCRKCGMVRVD